MGIIQWFRKTAADWVSENPRIAPGEPAYESDTGRAKIGDANWTIFTGLPYLDQLHVVGGISAINPPAQGSGPLTGQVNDVTTVGAPGDCVTLRAASIGEVQVVMNHGANALRIYPASGNNLGAGANNPMTIDLAAGDMVIFFCWGASNWSGFSMVMET